MDIDEAAKEGLMEDQQIAPEEGGEAEETPEIEPEEESDEEPEETPEGEESPEEPDDESEDDDALDWNEWKSAHDLPDSIADEDQLAEAYKEALREMKRLQNQEPRGGQPAPTNQPPDYGPMTFRSMVLSQLAKEGKIREEDLADFAPIMPVLENMFDRTIGGFLKVIEQQEETKTGVRRDLQDEIQWANLPKKDAQGKTLFTDKDRKELQAIKTKHNFDTYEEAALWRARSNPDVQKRAFNKGVEKGKHRLNKFSKKRNRGGGQKAPSYVVKGELDQDRLLKDVQSGKLTDAQADKIIDDFVRAAG